MACKERAREKKTDNEPKKKKKKRKKIVVTEIYEKVWKIRGRLWGECMGELKLKWIMI